MVLIKAVVSRTDLTLIDSGKCEMLHLWNYLLKFYSQRNLPVLQLPVIRWCKRHISKSEPVITGKNTG